jgi:hypothetical protein
MKEKGIVRFTNWGAVPFAIAQASDLEPDSTHNPFRWHTEKHMPYPTLTRRAQFYIDHDWFLEAGEQLPVHKPNPRQGGDHPLTMTSGHSRWTVHSANSVNPMMLQTHRTSLCLNRRHVEIENGGRGACSTMFVASGAPRFRLCEPHSSAANRRTIQATTDPPQRVAGQG